MGNGETKVKIKVNEVNFGLDKKTIKKLKKVFMWFSNSNKKNIVNIPLFKDDKHDIVITPMNKDAYDMIKNKGVNSNTDFYCLFVSFKYGESMCFKSMDINTYFIFEGEVYIKIMNGRHFIASHLLTRKTLKDIYKNNGITINYDDVYGTTLILEREGIYNEPTKNQHKYKDRE